MGDPDGSDGATAVSGVGILVVDVDGDVDVDVVASAARSIRPGLVACAPEPQDAAVAASASHPSARIHEVVRHVTRPG